MRGAKSIMAKSSNMVYKTLIFGFIVLFIGASISSSICYICKASFIFKSNNPPYPPSEPIPADDTKNQSFCGVNLCWTGGDPDGDEVTYDVYYGNYSPPPIVESNYSGNCTDWDLPPYLPLLEPLTTYYWKIVAWDEHGASTAGPIWSFTTEPNYPPNKAQIIQPPDGAKNVPGNVIMCWNGSDPNQCDLLRYDVYFGPNPDPPLVLENTLLNCYDPYGPDDLPFYKDFYWSVTTRDYFGLETEGDEWTFKTGVNEPPTDPDFDVPSRWPVGVELFINVSSTDPLEQKIKYIVDWGDGTTDETRFYESGESNEICHTYEIKGVYVIRVWAEDEYGAKSNCSEYKIVIPRTVATYYHWFEWFLEKFLFLEVLLRIMRL